MNNTFVMGISSNGKQSGKSTFAKFYKKYHSDENWCEIVNFATPLKNMLETALQYAGIEETNPYLYGNKKEEILPVFNKSGRFLMQKLGTEWGRYQVDKDLWINLFNNYIYELNSEGIFINDSVRFKNEVEYINGLKNSLSIKIVRGECKEDHPSELNIDNSLFDIVIHNDGTLEQLEKAASISFHTQIKKVKGIYQDSWLNIHCKNM